VQAKLCVEDRVPTLFETYSLASEQFRLLATRLQQLRESRALKSLLLTSSVADEGKSLLSVNLAIAMAHCGQQKVLLVEADLRKPSLCRTLRVGELQGIRDWYRTDRSIMEFMHRIAGTHVWLLPAGREQIDPLELINSARMADLFAATNAVFDWVLIDSCPLLPMADAGIMSRMSDATVVVVRRDKTPKSALKEALERVTPPKMLGFLLNEFSSTSHYGYELRGVRQHAGGAVLDPQLRHA
jgi:capsular exopolysaccharide synthesis family protein